MLAAIQVKYLSVISVCCRTWSYWWVSIARHQDIEWAQANDVLC